MKIYLNKLKRFHQPSKAHLLALASAIISGEKIDVHELSLTYVDNTYIWRLNKDYLHKDRPTDVIAFTLSEANEPLIGDVYISVEQAKIQAVDYNVTLANEIVRLTTHGLLHVLGYDHMSAEDAKVMTSKEDEWVSWFEQEDFE